MYGVSNLDNEIYFNGGGPKVVGDPSSGEVGPDSIMWICSQTKLITSVSSFPHHISAFSKLIRRNLLVGCFEISRTRKNHFWHSRQRPPPSISQSHHRRQNRHAGNRFQTCRDGHNSWTSSHHDERSLLSRWTCFWWSARRIFFRKDTSFRGSNIRVLPSYYSKILSLANL